MKTSALYSMIETEYNINVVPETILYRNYAY